MQRIIFCLSVAVLLTACGSEPRRSLKEINPVVYMHRFDSVSWAVRVNQVQRVSKNVHNPLDFATKDDYYGIWVVLPDTVGVFRGRDIGIAITHLDTGGIRRSDAFPSRRVEIGGGWIRMKGMSPRGLNGKYRLVRVGSDPYVRREWKEQLLEPLPPWRPDSTGR